MLEKIPNFCPSCEFVRVDDPTYRKSPSWMDQDDIRCWMISGMCKQCFRYANGRDIMTPDDADDFIKENKEHINGD